MKHIYIFSGLGADHRVFKYIDLPAYKITHVAWVDPTKNESLGSYAERLCHQITTLKPILIGLSFGGIIAVEIAKHIDTEKIILISSIKSRKEIPFRYRFTGALRLYKIVPSIVLVKPNRIVFWLFGAHTTEEKQLLTEILNDTKPSFLKWAIAKIPHWRNTTYPKKLFQIHGDVDRILPLMNKDNVNVIKDGGHFMILNKATEVNNVLEKILSS
jgi:pimeloyl-ACP methyl ester carboxylesterase